MHFACRPTLFQKFEVKCRLIHVKQEATKKRKRTLEAKQLKVALGAEGVFEIIFGYFNYSICTIHKTVRVGQIRT